MLKSLFLGLLLIAAFTASPANAISYLDEIVRAKTFRFENEEVIVEKVDLGKARLGLNDVKLSITNKADHDKEFLVMFGGEPGLGAIGDFDMVRVNVKARGTLKVSTVYRFTSMSPFARLSVIIYDSDGEKDPLFKSRYHLGAANPAQKYDLSKFVSRSSEHLNLYALPGTLAAENADTILVEREDGLRRIAEMSGVDFDGTIDFYLYPDKDSKTKDTMHIGEGWGFNRVLVEVYNDDIKLDPFHEMSHIVTGTLGTPPPLFDEGFAVYAAEIQGADALLWLGWPGQQVDDVVRQLRDEGRLIPLADLIAVTNIGDSEERAVVEYPESASFVKFLVEAYGAETFREIFSTLKNSDGPETVAANLAAFEAITGKTLDELEAEWVEGF